MSCVTLEQQKHTDASDDINFIYSMFPRSYWGASNLQDRLCLPWILASQEDQGDQGDRLRDTAEGRHKKTNKQWRLCAEDTALVHHPAAQLKVLPEGRHWDHAEYQEDPERERSDNTQQEISAFASYQIDEFTNVQLEIHRMAVEQCRTVVHQLSE